MTHYQHTSKFSPNSGSSQRVEFLQMQYPSHACAMQLLQVLVGPYTSPVET